MVDCTQMVDGRLKVGAPGCGVPMLVHIWHGLGVGQAAPVRQSHVTDVQPQRSIRTSHDLT